MKAEIFTHVQVSTHTGKVSNKPNYSINKVEAVVYRWEWLIILIRVREAEYRTLCRYFEKLSRPRIRVWTYPGRGDKHRKRSAFSKNPKMSSRNKYS